MEKVNEERERLISVVDSLQKQEREAEEQRDFAVRRHEHLVARLKAVREMLEAEE